MSENFPSNANSSVHAPSLRTHIIALQSAENIERKWRDLESVADCSFFLSWGWIGTWISQAENFCNLHIYEAYLDDQLIALALIDKGSFRRRRVITSNTIALNESVSISQNMFIEYNGLVIRRGNEQIAWAQFLRDLCAYSSEWDEIRLTNIQADAVDEKLIEQLGLRCVIDAENSPWVADLTDISDLDSIMLKLGRNRRWQLRRSIKEYEKEGPLTIDAAQTLEQALSYFQQMGELHSARWQRVGKRGAYARKNWVAFHRALIENTFHLNQIQLLRIRCGNRNIGFIYNFIWRGAVLVLQTGFVSESQNTLRPGYISHLLAMRLNASLGAVQYDFMIGDSEYKSALGVAGARQLTMRLQRPRVKFAFENAVVSIARRAR